jgi:hypothetical protein
LSDHKIAWLEAEIDAMIAARAEERNKKPINSRPPEPKRPSGPAAQDFSSCRGGFPSGRTARRGGGGDPGRNRYACNPTASRGYRDTNAVALYV